MSHAIETRVTRLLGIRYPIVQGGLARVAFADLAAAVSNAGGLGQILGTNLLIMAFGHRGFAVGTAYAKTEAVQGAVLALVLLGERIFGGPTDHVTMHNVSASRAAVEHLVALGRRRIAVDRTEVAVSVDKRATD